MYAIHDAPVFQLVFDILKDYHILHGKFTKTEKYTLGAKIEDALLSMLLHIIEAGHAKKEWKLSPLENALSKTELTKILMRLAFELKLLHEKQYLDLQERLQRTAQMLGGWRRSI